MKIVIIGGHLSPALAIIEALPKETEVLFIGRKHTFEGDKSYSLEYNTARSLKIPSVEISTGRLQRKFTRYTIPSLLKIPYGFLQAFFILYKFKPDVVLGFGGYLSIPVVFSAYMLRIPIVIHEQTLEAGLANRIASYFATKVCISWESSRTYFPKEKTVLTGNPIRKFKVSDSEFTFPNRHSGKPRQLAGRIQNLSGVGRSVDLPRMTSLYNIGNKLSIIYITGGSSGSHLINRLIENCINQLLEKFIVIHQTGDAQSYHDFDRLLNLRDSLPAKLKARYFLAKFVKPQDIYLLLQKADLVVSRSGINTITELIHFNKPALLIPHPYSQGKEQLKNALFLKSLGLGEILEQKYLTSNILLQKVKEIVNNINKYKIKDHSITSLETAAQKIMEVVEYVHKKKKKKKTAF